MDLDTDRTERRRAPRVPADQLPVPPGTSLRPGLQVLHHLHIGHLGVEVVALDERKRRRVRAQVLVPLRTGKASDPDGRHALAGRLARVRDFHHAAHLDLLGTLTKRLARNTSFVVLTERPAGRPLDRHLEQAGSLPVSTALAVADALAELLVAAHAKGLRHLAIEPSHVHVDPDALTQGVADVQLADLGLLPAIRSVAPGLSLPMSPRRVAPEVLRGRRVDDRADVYGLGALLRMMTAGREIPDDLAALMRAATRSRPEGRPDSMHAFRDALAAVLATVESSEQPPTDDASGGKDLILTAPAVSPARHPGPSFRAPSEPAPPPDAAFEAPPRPERTPERSPAPDAGTPAATPPASPPPLSMPKPTPVTPAARTRAVAPEPGPAPLPDVLEDGPQDTIADGTPTPPPPPLPRLVPTASPVPARAVGPEAPPDDPTSGPNPGSNMAPTGPAPTFPPAGESLIPAPPADTSEESSTALWLVLAALPFVLGLIMLAAAAFGGSFTRPSLAPTPPPPPAQSP